MPGPVCDSHRRGLIEHVLAALRPSLADPAAVSRITREVEQFDSYSLAAAASAADPVFLVAQDDGEGAFRDDPDFVQGAREDAMADLRRVVEAGRLRTEERREHGARRVATRITEDQLGRWRISRRPTTRPGRLLARPRARRSSTGRRRGSRRGTGSGNRAGSGDDPDDDGGEPEPARGGRVGRSRGRGRRGSARRLSGGAA